MRGGAQAAGGRAASTSLLLAEIAHAEAGFPAGVLNVVPGRGAAAGRARWSSTPASTRSRSPAAPRPGIGRHRGAPTDSARRRWNSAARARRSSSPTPTSRPPPTAWRWASSPTRARCAPRARRILVPRDPRRIRRPARRRAPRPWCSVTRSTRHHDGRADQRQAARPRCGYIERGRAEGAASLGGGGRPDRTGFFVEPTMFAGASNTMTIAREEIFGPVGAIIAVRHRRGRRARQRQRLRACRDAVDQRLRRAHTLARAGARRAVVGQRLVAARSRACPGAA